MLSPVEYVVWPIEWMLLTFHISVVCFVGHQAFLKKSPYTNGFFKLYLIQSAIDVCNYTASLALRLMKHKMLPREMLGETFLGKAQYFGLGYCSYFEYLSHTVIAINRYTVIEDRSNDRRIWSGKPFLAIMMLTFSIPMIATVRLFDGIVVIDGPDIYVIRSTVQWISLYNGVASTVITLVTCLISCYFELRTLVIFRRLSSHLKRERYDDYRLLLYAIVGLVAQVLLAVYYTFNFMISAYYPDIFAFTQQVVPYLVDLLSLYGSVCLFITSGTLRKGYLRFYGLSWFQKSGSVAPFSSTV